MKLIISCLLLLVLVALSHQETCTSNLYLETETPSLIGQCPVGYVNQGGKCNAFSALYKEKRTSTTCSLTTDCLFTSLDCYNQKCTPKFRLVGDACVKDSQCLYQKTSSITSLFDLLNIPKCFNGKCALVKKESTKKNGETCGTYDSTTNTFYDCEGGYTCGITLTGGKCIPIVTAKKGESCYPVLDGSKSIVCESGTTCKVSLTSAICVAEIQQDQPCIKLPLDANYVPCAAGLTCRQKSNSDTSNTCQRWASYGDYCSIKSDCAFVNSEMVDCVDNKCKRIYSAPIGQTCKDNKECYTSYCSAEGKCADPSELKCSDSLACPILYGSQCACGGKAFSTTSGGKCAAACTGAYYDVMTCIYNLGVITPTSSMVGSGISQYVDEDSSMFTRCRYAYNRYYSCLRQSWTKAGIATKGDMDGVSLNSYSATDSGLLPERSAANIQIVSFAVLMIASLFLVLF